ncbi:MAG: hypothetical protein O3A51_08000, partial [Verrucomicrobia bacterium]|nr:hypothetical protein [Verrucomicrobiota bacterium]
MLKTRWITASCLLAFLLVAVLLCVPAIAQNFDEDNLIVAEDMAIDEALSADFGDDSGDLFEEEFDMGLEDSIGESLVMPAADDDLFSDFGDDAGLGADEMGDAPEFDDNLLGGFDAPMDEKGMTSDDDGTDPFALPDAELPGDDTFDDLSVGDVDFDTEMGDAMGDDAGMALGMEADLGMEMEADADMGTDDLDSMPEVGDLDSEIATFEAEWAEATQADAGQMDEPSEMDDRETVMADDAMMATDMDAPEMDAAAMEAPAMDDKPLDPRSRAIEVLREGEELRRRAFAGHAAEKLASAERAFAAKDYEEARNLYDQSIKAFEQIGDRAGIKGNIERARDGANESIYRRALFLYKGGDLENASKLATEASYRGHAKAPKLVERIKLETEKPEPPPPPADKRWKEEEYVLKTKDVKEKLQRGREHFLVGEFDLAQDVFESVLAVDPHNTEAIRWREKVTLKKYDRASMELETTRQDMMNQVREAWNPGDYADVGDRTPPPPPTGPENVTDRQKILKKMGEIIIPEIDFRQANIHDVVEFLQEASLQFDETGDTSKGINIILNLGAGGGTAPAPVQDDIFGSFSSAPAAPVGSVVDLITFRARE